MTDHDKPFSASEPRGQNDRRVILPHRGSNGLIRDRPLTCSSFCHSHGGTGCGSVHTITAQTARHDAPRFNGLAGLCGTTGSLDSGEGPSKSARSGCPLLYILDLITTVL